MKHTVWLRKGRGNLVPVKRMVTKRGKPYLQTFYVSPDKAPKAPEKPKMIAAPDTKLLAAPEPEWRGPLGDDRAYVRIGADELARAVRIPESVIRERFQHKGFTFVVHRPYLSEKDGFANSSWDVTEVETGSRMPRAAGDNDARQIAISKVEQKGVDWFREAIDRQQKISEIPTERFDESPVVTMAASNDDIQKVTDHIMSNVIDDSMDRDDVEYWVERHIDTNISAQNFIEDIDSDNWFEMELAIKYGMDFEEGEDVAKDLSTVADWSGADFDTVTEWYEKHYEGETLPSLYHLGTSSEYGNDWEDSDVVTYAIDNDVDLYAAQIVAEEATEESDNEYRSQRELHDVYDSQGNLWTTEELETMARWMGGDVSGPREHGREYDRALREGDEPRMWNDIADLFMTKAVEVPQRTLYRGSPNPVWAEIQPGQRYECGFASFSKDEDFVKGFTLAKPNEAGYHKFVIVCEAQEGEDLFGIDLHDIGQSLRDEGVENETFDTYEREEEVVLRAPSLEVTRTEDVMENMSKIRYIYVKTADMHLVDLIKSQFGSLNERVWESFNEPLGAPRGTDESDTTPPTES